MVESYIDVMERFTSRVEVLENGCWQWLGYLDPAGYGHISIRSNSWGAHQFSYFVYKDTLIKGLTIDHLCRNRGCVNPNHLEQVTYAENIRRGINKAVTVANRTHCKQGHPYNQNNTRRRPSGRRCIECSKKASLNWYYNNKRRQLA